MARVSGVAVSNARVSDIGGVRVRAMSNEKRGKEDERAKSRISKRGITLC
ncbi:MAG: hypothetical protein LBK25_04960 [Treponema sp.]|nr:hypothetical protein [Treponema sp.]